MNCKAFYKLYCFPQTHGLIIIIYFASLTISCSKYLQRTIKINSFFRKIYTNFTIFRLFCAQYFNKLQNDAEVIYVFNNEHLTLNKKNDN